MHDQSDDDTDSNIVDLYLHRIRTALQTMSLDDIRELVEEIEATAGLSQDKTPE